MRDMNYDVVFYCPDQHIRYNLYTLDERGVGGGITARIRATHALAAFGHEVQIYANCPNDETIDGVGYLRCNQLAKLDTDIFIVSTSGSGLDLSELSNLQIGGRLRILMVHGIDPPVGVDLTEFDFIYALSNFVRQIIVERWGIEGNKVFVSHRGVKSELYESKVDVAPKRDPFGIVYTGHPSKGLESAIAVTRLLRQLDPRFSLHIYGGYRLWGEKERAIDEEPGVFYHGLIGQRQLAQQMQEFGFSLNLQTRPEPFGMVIIEAMKAGCIVIASHVGAFPEIIQHGRNGFLIYGDHTDAATRLSAAEHILELVSQPDYCSSIRETAIVNPLDWQTIADAWSGHWDWVLGKKQPVPDQLDKKTCSSCGAGMLSLADGFHCIGCGNYQRDLTS